MKWLLVFFFFLFNGSLSAKRFIDSYWLHCDAYQSSSNCKQSFHEWGFYPDFDNNPSLTSSMKKRFYPFLLPVDHPLKPRLDALFSSRRLTENKEILIEAGFKVLHSQLGSFITVARHPDFPGIIFKLYLDSETRRRLEYPGWYWLANRCEGARKIREYIKRYHIKHFDVTEKWLYVLPLSTEATLHPVLIVETDMNVVKKSEVIWKEMNDKVVLDELYLILSHGYGSCKVDENVPYSQNGQFVFIDTEYPKRALSLNDVKMFLSEKMCAYWDQLIEKK